MPSSSRPCVAFASTVVLLAMGASTRVCEGAEPCKVEVVEPVAGEWKTAAHKLASDLDAAAPETDCSRVELRVEGKHTVVTYVTRDGRRADRRLEAPEDLGPTVAALRTTVPLEEAPSGQQVFSDDLTRDSASKPAKRSDSAEQGSGIVVSLGTGARMGSSALVSTTVEGRAAVWLRDWELGMMARAEPEYYQLKTRGEPQKRTGAVAGGFSVGRRAPLGNRFALLGGTSMLLAIVDQPDTVDGASDDPVVEGRLGGYFGMVYPRDAALRFRASVSGEMVPHRLGQSLRDTQGNAISSWWAFGLTMGIEVGR